MNLPASRTNCRRRPPISGPTGGVIAFLQNNNLSYVLRFHRPLSFLRLLSSCSALHLLLYFVYCQPAVATLPLD